jgi:membrane fusion protein (multidrug efflux system)
MKKKRLKKIANNFIMIAFLALIVLKLLANKRQSDSELSGFRAFEQVTPVTVTSASFVPIEETGMETGVFEPYRKVSLISETQGQVLELKVKTGDKVRKGELLATIDKGLLDEQLTLARLNMQNAEEDLHRFESLVESEAATDQQLEQVRLKYENAVNQVAVNKEHLEHTRILAPVDGYISSRSIAQGSYISPGMPLMTISEQSRLLFVVQVAESSLSRIKPGQKVQVFPTSLPDECLDGVVDELSVNTSISGRYPVSILVDNSSSTLKPGMTGQARFSLSEREGMILPRKCILKSILDPSVYLVSGDSVVERKVKARLLSETQILVQDGLVEGEQVVLTGHINLVPGSKIRISN